MVSLTPTRYIYVIVRKAQWCIHIGYLGKFQKGVIKNTVIIFQTGSSKVVLSLINNLGEYVNAPLHGGTDENTEDWSVDSRVISVSVENSNRRVYLKSPVKITMENVNQNRQVFTWFSHLLVAFMWPLAAPNKSLCTACVFWSTFSWTRTFLLCIIHAF